MVSILHCISHVGIRHDMVDAGKGYYFAILHSAIERVE